MGNVASNTKKLYRDMDNRMISGVCSGLAEYLDLDVSIVRVLWIIMTIMTGIVGGVIAYLLMVFIVPMK
ncbi:MAG: PspC domain-containing protein [Acidobacteria bacterium]|nr:PspC domain-containing protein [Acidobacteriota bacterium]